MYATEKLSWVTRCIDWGVGENLSSSLKELRKLIGLTKGGIKKFIELTRRGGMNPVMQDKITFL